MSDSLQPHELQHARPPCPSLTPGVHRNPCLSSQWCHSTISSSVIPFSSCPLSQHQGLFKWVSSSHLLAKVLEFQLQHQSFQWIPRTDILYNTPRPTLSFKVYLISVLFLSLPLWGWWSHANFHYVFLATWSSLIPQLIRQSPYFLKAQFIPSDTASSSQSVPSLHHDSSDWVV